MKNVFISFAILLTLLFIYSCSESPGIVENTAPNAEFSFSPSNIDTSTIVSFDASLSSDNEDPQNTLKFRWDFEGKQNWTDATSSSSASYRFSKSGSYKVGLRVVDTEGWSGENFKQVIVLDSI